MSHWCLASDFNTEKCVGPEMDSSGPILHLCSLCGLGGVKKDKCRNWILTDALEIGSCPVGNVCGFVKHTLRQAGCPGFTLET